MIETIIMIQLRITRWLTNLTVVIVTSILPVMLYGQSDIILDRLNEPFYYIGINPIAPFANIRESFTSGYLPAISNLETGVSAFVGKVWDRNYNVETRCSFGSPGSNSTLFLVQSGFNYCFSGTKKNWQPYVGSFIKIYGLHAQDTRYDYGSLISYVCAGNRFMRKNFFLDLRINQHIYALSWSTVPGENTSAGFQPSTYKWKSAYIPFVGIGVGFLFR